MTPAEIKDEIAMKKRPILFSGPMVRAILDGRKTQTRRVVAPQPIRTEIGWAWKPDSLDRSWNDRPEDPYNDPTLATPALRCECPYGRPGERLWVRETFYCDDYRYPDIPDSEREDVRERMVYYAADGPVENQIAECDGVPKLTPSIFMPRWASRITLEITAVRVERVQNISDAYAVAEGIAARDCLGPVDPATGGRPVNCPQWAYQQLWDSINKKRGYGWDVNPWVWVIEFKRV